MAESISDHDEIVRVVQLYVEGTRRGDSGPLKEAFHGDARMFGSLAGIRYDVPITDLFELVDSGAADVDGSYQARVVSVQQVGDAAAATLVEEGTWGAVSFVDFFTLVRVDGTWKIASKTFAHTGGAPPSH
jgi:putative lumazine-binding protein